MVNPGNVPRSNNLVKNALLQFGMKQK